MIRKYDIAGDRKKESPRILLRRRVRELLGSGDPEQVIRELGKIPPRKAISPLISVFYDSDPDHPRLAEEYVRILLSYIREDGNFLEYEPLRRGALWGIGRLARVYPEMLIELDAARYIRPYLESDDPLSRSLSARALRMLGDKADY